MRVQLAAFRQGKDDRPAFALVRRLFFTAEDPGCALKLKSISQLPSGAQENEQETDLTFGEETFYEGPGPVAELVVSLLLGATLVYLVCALWVFHKALVVSFCLDVDDH